MSARGIAPPLAPADLLERAARALDDAPDKPLLLSLPASGIDPIALLAPGDDAFLFIDRDGHVLVGRGSVFGIGGDGPGRFAEVRDRTRALRSILHVAAIDDVDPPPARFIAGGAFEPHDPRSRDWRDFADLWSSIPRFAWIDDPARGPRLQIAFSEGAHPMIRKRTLDSLESLLASPAPGSAHTPALRGNVAADDDRERFRRLVEGALVAIERGPATKIVTARSARLAADGEVDTRALAAALLRADGTYRYLARIGDTTFAGASPERLVEKQGGVVRTEAVAGTAPAEHEDAPLDEREKDRREHLAVVLAIEEALAPLALALDHPDEPVVRKHGRIAHLVTPFEGRVAHETHVLDLADALHPTPAVAGTPRDVALDFIARHEELRRGWYAGPIGWFDLDGDGELAVALRCVRIEGSAVDVYAGAGIVAGSNPGAEFDETVLKMRSTLGSLGFELTA
ncbi:MAG TPA: isochorismate synthase [Longimicrobiales bacterium]|nr:isochorismate synthase [Longimicrobiales bacterium]